MTKVSKIESNKVVDGVKVPCEGKLFYRGYNIYDLIGGVVRDNRFGFEEIAYLLLFGELPNDVELSKFRDSLAYSRTLPTKFCPGRGYESAVQGYDGFPEQEYPYSGIL